MGIETLVSMDSSQQMVEEDIDSEAEDEVIHPHDNLIVVGHVQDDASVLEVYGKPRTSYSVFDVTISDYIQYFNFNNIYKLPI